MFNPNHIFIGTDKEFVDQLLELYRGSSEDESARQMIHNRIWDLMVEKRYQDANSQLRHLMTVDLPTGLIEALLEVCAFFRHYLCYMKLFDYAVEKFAASYHPSHDEHWRKRLAMNVLKKYDFYNTVRVGEGSFFIPELDVPARRVPIGNVLAVALLVGFTAIGYSVFR